MTEPVRPLEALKQAEEHLTNLRLELNDWVPCSTQEQLARWRDIQQRLINCAKVVGVLQAAAPPAPTADLLRKAFEAGYWSWPSHEALTRSSDVTALFRQWLETHPAPPAPTAEPTIDEQVLRDLETRIFYAETSLKALVDSARLWKSLASTPAAPPERVSEGKE